MKQHSGDARGGMRTPGLQQAGSTHIIAIGGGFALITLAHLYTDPSYDVLHLLYHRLYYIPILYTGLIFGLRGGLLAALTASALLAPTVLVGGGAGIADAVNEMALYVLIGGLFGWMRDVEGARTHDLRRMGRRLEEAYSKLEERNFELVSIQEYTDAILQSITSAVITVDPDASVATANQAAERMLGIQEVDMVARVLSALFSDDGGLVEEAAKVLEGRVPHTTRAVTFVTRGGEVHVQASISRMQDADAQVIGAVITLEDVSEVKALTVQLIRADRLAALGELTAGVAHEVRNPLGIIRAMVQFLKEEDFDPERVLEAGDIIDQEVERLDRVVKAFLDIGRPLALTFMRVSVNQLLKEVVLFTDGWAGRSNVTIEVDYKEDLPQIMADPHQVKQVFVNLISNAVQAMGDGGTLKVRTGIEEGFIWIRFCDDGPGIGLEDLEKVFDPFYSTREDGTGLGLTIVHRIVDDHDGHIELASSPAEGTVFTVHLPIRADMAVGDMR